MTDGYTLSGLSADEWVAATAYVNGLRHGQSASDTADEKVEELHERIAELEAELGAGE